MREFILWLFNQVSNLVSLSLSWKIYGDFSFTHFILAGMFIFAIFRFFGFASNNYGEVVDQGVSIYNNVENKHTS